MFKIVSAQGGLAFQDRLFELAVTPGRIRVRRAAARAMLVEADTLDSAVVCKITTSLLATQAPSIAVILTLIAACRAALNQRLDLARGISANPKRRALVLLMLWPAVSPCESSKTTIEQLLPENHSSLAWVNAGPNVRAADDLIADLGDPTICREVLSWLNPKGAKS